MPVCLACTQGRALAMQPLGAVRTLSTFSRRFPSRVQHYTDNLRRSISPVRHNLDTSVVSRVWNRTGAFARRSFSSSPEVPARIPQALTLLHKTRSFLPRALRPGNSLDFWNQTVSEVSDDLSAGKTAGTEVQIAGEHPS